MTNILTDLIPFDTPYIVGHIDELADVKHQLYAHNAAILVKDIEGLGKTTVAQSKRKRNIINHMKTLWEV